MERKIRHLMMKFTPSLTLVSASCLHGSYSYLASSVHSILNLKQRRSFQAKETPGEMGAKFTFFVPAVLRGGSSGCMLHSWLGVELWFP